MSNRLWRTAALMCAAVCLAVPVSAQQTLNFSLGYFAPKGYDSRVQGDVLVANRDFLIFDISDFGGAAVGGEWLVALGRYLEAGAGLQYTRRPCPVSTPTSRIPTGPRSIQDTRLRRLPIDFTVRVLPFGQGTAVQPYVGGGLTVINWHYKEFGEFVDFDAGRRIFIGEFPTTARR